MLSYEEIVELKARLEKENVYLQEEIRTEHNFEEIIGNSPALLAVLRKVEQVAPTDSTVLIYGETGTGKELIARAIHDRSARKNRPLLKVNCSAISAGLVESELFGHVKGAFTGAFERHVGRFELADGGTIFLDEIGELPLETQVKLLRVLQEREFEPVGSNRPVRVDVRVIAATNRNLQESIRTGDFRSDLFYRLNVFPIDVPPLRERSSDIPQLAMFFLARFSKKFGKNIQGMPRETRRPPHQLFLAREYQGTAKRHRASRDPLAKFGPRTGTRSCSRSDACRLLHVADRSSAAVQAFRFGTARVFHSGRGGARSYCRRAEPNARRRRGAARSGKNFRVASQYPSPPNAEVGTQAQRLPRIVVPTNLFRANHQILWLACTRLKSMNCK